VIEGMIGMSIAIVLILVVEGILYLIKRGW
jgi:uncharacterized protein YjeT (DUF2065 family)